RTCRQKPNSNDAENPAAQGRAEIGRRRRRAGDCHYPRPSPPKRSAAAEGGWRMMAVTMIGTESAFAATATPDPGPSPRQAPSPQGGGGQRRRVCIRSTHTVRCAFPPPLRGRVGEGGRFGAVRL